jgi:glutathione S-transferase
MKLYVMQGACSLASHIALIWADIPFELTVLSHDDVGSDGFRRINAKGGVPALVLDDGTVITESLAILSYIADVAPEARLGAATGDPVGRAQLNESLSDLVSEVHKSWGPFFAPDRFATRPEGWPDAKAAAFGQLDKHYRRLNGIMDAKDWRVLGHRTVADAYLYVMCVWKDMTPTPLSEFPNLAAFKARLDSDPAVVRAVAEEAPGQDNQTSSL